MMLRGLVEEIIRRRLWPVALVALLVAGAVPLFLLKSAPNGASSPAQLAQDAPAVPAAAGLPARAQRLLTTTDFGQAPGKRPKRGKDPFQAPSGMHPATDAAQAAATATAARSSTSGSASKPVPVVITDPSGTKVQPTPGPVTTTGGSAATPTTAKASRADIDVRYSKHGTRHVSRSIPRMKPFSAAGKVIASFVKYSPSRRAAVFAVSPGTVVGGVACRQVAGICRYVAIRAGRHARLTLITNEGLLITRRIDVVHISLTPANRAASSGTGRPASVPHGACLLNKLLELGLGDPPVQRTACA